MYACYETDKILYLVLELLTGGELFDTIIAKVRCQHAAGPSIYAASVPRTAAPAGSLTRAHAPATRLPLACHSPATRHDHACAHADRGVCPRVHRRGTSPRRTPARSP